MKFGKPVVAGLLLAAGASTRMADLKQLLPVRGRPMLSAVLGEALTSDLDQVVLVLGHRASDIRKSLGSQLRHPRLQIIENPNYLHGISSSIKAGLREIREQCDHAMILLADMPFLEACHINTLLRAYLVSGQPLGALAVAGRRSHPVVFSRDLFGELDTLEGDVGARELFRKYADSVCLAPSGKDWDDRDIDTPEDYAAIGRNGKNIEYRIRNVES
ncbi:MAG: nucleotidyltransferase family protein [Deltaproteobacteria bacterium]|nr:nucleotidyltransferase family protein [Deltaproteobacteria bacterium]MBW1818442.1 nucleotidyltransferase family protein [Deltaproteobacteria bacterium]MBW2283671.1 nucleotidyltransferase family protein [Deltaproteobacteria bacterium]